MRKGYIEPTEKLRRFYGSAVAAPLQDRFSVMLDGRILRTPKGAPLVLPTLRLAELVAEEWASQGEILEMGAMHATRLANTAAEAIPGARHETAQNVADYAGSDLLCYFAENPAGLAARQQERWIPWLDRAERELGLRFVRVEGIIHQPQPAATLQTVKALALATSDFELAGLAFGAALFGSTVLTLALHRGWLSGLEAFELSRLDEAWQEEKWGVDEEAAERTERLRGEAVVLERWFGSAAG